MPRAEPDPTPRQRWIAAQRLAAGDPPRLAAAMAGVSAEALRLLLAADPEFAGLVEDCRAIEHLPLEAKRARLAGLAWQQAERALLDGRVSTLNLCLRSQGLLEDEVGEDADDPEAYARAFFAELSEDEFAEIEAAGEDCRRDPDHDPGLLRAVRNEERARRGLPPDRGPNPAPAASGTALAADPPPAPATERDVTAARPMARPSGRILPARDDADPVLSDADAAAAWPAGLPSPAASPAEVDPWPFPPAPDPAALAQAPRPNPKGPTVPRLRMAKEPVPAWHRHPSAGFKPGGP